MFNEVSARDASLDLICLPILKLFGQREWLKQIIDTAGGNMKNEGQELKSRQTVLLTVEQKQIIERRRGAGRLGSVDSSTFVREWLVRSGMFDTVKNPVLENPLDNLNNSFK